MYHMIAFIFMQKIKIYVVKWKKGTIFIFIGTMNFNFMNVFSCFVTGL